MKKIGIVLAAIMLLVLMSTAVSPSQLAPAEDEFFNIYVTFWSGDLRIFALADNTLVTIYDLDTGKILSLDDPRISDSPAPNFDTNPFILAEAGDAFEGVGGLGPIDQEIRVSIEATDATDPTLPRPILAWTGSLAKRLRHPTSTQPPGMGKNPWMSYIPGLPESTGEPVVMSRKLGREFLGFTSRELYLFAHKGDEDTAITILDLETNTDADTDDSQTLGPSDAITTTDEIEIYYLDQFEDDTLRISSNVDVSALAGIASQVADDFTITPPSYAPEDEGLPKGRLFYTFVSGHLAVFPLEDDTTVTITDLSDGDDSITITLGDGDSTGDYEFYTPVLSSEDPDYGDMMPRPAAPAVTLISNNDDHFDNDFVKIESDKPILAYVGPIKSDVNEFAGMQLAVPDEPTFRTVYTYAQDSGQSNDLQIFARSADTEVTITSLTYTEGFEAQGKEETWHDFTIGPGIGGANGWHTGTPDHGVWWGSDIWAGEVLRIQSNLPVLVLGGDYDVPHFGAFTPYFAPDLPTIKVVKEVKRADDDTTSFDFTFVDEDFALKNGESELFDSLVAGTYTVTETVPENWLLTDITCDNGYQQTDPDEPQVTIDLRWAEHVVCTFTNEPKLSSIKVIKEVKGIDDNTSNFDFTFVDEDFTLKNGESKLFEDLVSGTYTITETVPDSWLLAEITCDNGVVEINPDPPQVIVDLGWAEDVACTFTNEIPTAVELTSFTAEPDSDRVTLRWQTGSEIDNEGFNVWRSESADGTYTQLNASLIPARGNADSGASYKYVDTAVVKDTTYYYKLEDVDSHGASTLHGPISATPTRIWRIFIPFATGAIMLPGAAVWQRKKRPS